MGVPRALAGRLVYWPLVRLVRERDLRRTGGGVYVGRINIAEIRRRQIVDAAIRVMAERGWNDTSIDEITREAGVSRGLVSYHFKDKADLLSGVLARCQEAFNKAIAQAAAASDDRVEQMRITIRAAIEYTRTDPAIYEVFLHFTANGRANPELGEQIRNLYAGFRKASAAAIRRGQAEGVFRNDIDPMAAAARQNGAITGFALQWLLDPESFPFDDAAQQIEEMLMLYLTSGPKNEPPTEDGAAVVAQGASAS